MIEANKLIYWFYYMYENNWGYIWGKSGQLWTEKMQNNATNEMAKKYGKKWIGHYVTDCSGAFVYAFKKEGQKIHHGSDTIYKKYCTIKGKLVKGAREDGEAIRPGTAVFLYGGEKNNYHHIGLYVGNDTCIEAKGTLYGVVVSRLSHWDYWGELKDVDYTNAQAIEVGPRSDGVGKRLLRRGCNGTDVEALQTALNHWSADGDILKVDGSFGKLTEDAVKLFQTANGLKADGLVGPQTWKALELYLNENQKPSQKTVKMTVVCYAADGIDEAAIKNEWVEWLSAKGLIPKEGTMEVTVNA